MDGTRYLCLMFTMGVVVSARPALDCYSVSDVQAAEGACFSDQGLDVTRPYFYTPWTGRLLAGYIDAVLKQIPESVCQKPDSFRRALACLGDIIQQCGLSSISPTTTLPQIVDKLCIHDTNLNLTCAASKFTSAMMCEFVRGFQIGLSAHSMSMTSADYCKVYKAQDDCQRSLYHSCGCATVRAYETIYLDIYYEAICPQSLSSISRVTCDDNTGIFLK